MGAILCKQSKICIMEKIITGRTANLADSFKKETTSMVGLMPSKAIILGSGLADAVENSIFFNKIGELQLNSGLSFAHLPNFTADGHRLRIILAEENSSKEKIVIVCGRKHLYEIDTDGDLKEVVRIPRSLAMAGVRDFYHTSAVGGINPNEPGSLIFVTDHDGSQQIPRGLFTGSDGSKFGPMFTACSDLYNTSISLKTVNKYSTKGVLQWHMGPMFETPAQIKRLQMFGIAGVGMSMLPEAIALKQMSLVPEFSGINNIGVGVVANPAAGIGDTAITHNDVKKVMTETAPKLMEFLAAIIKERVM